MLFPALKFLERIEVRVAIAKADDEAQRHLATRLMIEEPTAISVGQRPALAMDHQPRLMQRGIDVPQFLHAQAIDLRLAVRVQRELALQDLGQMPTRPFGKEGIFGVEFEAGLIIALMLAFAIDAHVAGGDTLHAAIFMIEDFGGGKAGEDFDTQPLGLFGQPAAQIAQRSGVGALIVHPARRHDVRHGHLAAFRQEPMLVVGHWRVGQRTAHVAPLRQQFVERLGIDHRARQNMCADFRAFFQYAHREFLTRFARKLFQPDCRRQAGRSSADDDDVIRHRFPFAHSPSMMASGGLHPDHPIALLLQHSIITGDEAP